MDYMSYHEAKKLRELLGIMIKNETKVIPTSMIIELNALDAIFAKDVQEMENRIEKSAAGSDNQYRESHITMFNRATTFISCEDGETSPVADTVKRIVPLPPRNHPHYRALLNIEAESIVREWCEIYIAQAGFK